MKESLGPFALGRVHCADGVEAMKQLPDGSVDVVLLDPPYNVGKKYDSYQNGLSPHLYSLWLTCLIGQAERITRDCILWFPGTSNLSAVDRLIRPPLRWHRTLAWYKREFAGDKWCGGPAMCWEPIIWASKIPAPFYNRIFGTCGRDMLEVSATHSDPLARLHPCPKPLPVLIWLVNLFVPKAGVIVDPCAGLGTTIVAAEVTGRSGLGFELSAEYARFTNQRIAAPELEVAERCSGQGQLFGDAP